MIRASARGMERRDRAGRVEAVAQPERLEDPRAFGTVRVEAALLGATPGALLDGRVEEQLEVRVRAARPCRCRGRPSRSRRSPRGRAGAPAARRGARARPTPRTRPRRPAGAWTSAGAIDAIDEHVRQPAGVVRGQLDLAGERAQRLGIGRRRRHGPGTARSPRGRAGRCRRTGSPTRSAAAAPTLLLPDEPGPSSATTSRGALSITCGSADCIASG